MKCGIFFKYAHWNQSQIISVSGKSDERVNMQPRIMFFRLYTDAQRGGTNKEVLNFWRGFILPDLKFIIQDSDKDSFSALCISANDPYLRTFDDRLYGIHKTEGEYILYQHTKFPVEVHAYYQKCDYDDSTGSGPLCDCGAAVRSGDSVFIINFCFSGKKPNIYAIQKICDEQDLRVTGGKNLYTVETMSGTKVVLTIGEVERPVENFYGIQAIIVLASNLDINMTSGLCGSFNDDPSDDLIPRGDKTAVEDPEVFAASWRLKSGEEDDSLFNISYIKPPKLYARPFCSCIKEAERFPWGKPQYLCNYAESLDSCSKLKVQNKVYKAPCKKESLCQERDLSNCNKELLRRERDISNVNRDPSPGNGHEIKVMEPGLLLRHRRDISEFDDDDAPVVYAMNITGGISMVFTGESSWDGISVDNFGTSCLNVASKVENLTRTNQTNAVGEEVSILNLIQAAVCPKNCSGRGDCLEGQCVCRDPYLGAACDAEKTQAPKLSPRAFNGLCDISLRPCHKFIVPGLNFVEGNLTCRFKRFTITLNETTFTETVEYADGIYNTPFSMQCLAPISRQRRSSSEKSSAFGYFMSVSNNGKNFTQDLSIIVYDSLCYECSTDNLTCTEVDTCPQVTPVIIPNEKSKIGVYIGAGAGGIFFVFMLILVIVYTS